MSSFPRLHRPSDTVPPAPKRWALSSTFSLAPPAPKITVIPPDIEPVISPISEPNPPQLVLLPHQTKWQDNLLIAGKISHGGIAKRQPMDLVLVIDISGSMNGTPLEIVKETINFVIDQVGENVRLSLVVFNTEAEILAGLTPMRQENKVAFKLLVSQIESGGGTSILVGEKAGIEVLKQRCYVQRNAAVFLLSDGEDNLIKYFPLSESLTKDIAGCVTVNTFGYGQDSGFETLKNLAQRDKGSFAWIKDQAHVADSFAIMLGGLLTVEIYNLEMKIDGNRVLKIYGDFPYSLGDTSTVTIPTLFGEETRDILFLVAGEKINTNVSITYSTLTSVIPRVTVPRSLILESVIDNVVNLDVDALHNRFSAAKLISKASRLPMDEAVQHLKEMIRRIEHSPSSEHVISKSILQTLRQVLEIRQETDFGQIGRNVIMSSADVQMSGRDFTSYAPTALSSIQSVFLAMSPSK